MYANPLLNTLALIVNMVVSNPSADSLAHYKKAVGYYTGMERQAVMFDSIRLAALTPALTVVERNSMSERHKWLLTERYNDLIKRPIQKYKDTFLDPIK